MQADFPTAHCVIVSAIANVTVIAIIVAISSSDASRSSSETTTADMHPNANNNGISRQTYFVSKLESDCGKL